MPSQTLRAEIEALKTRVGVKHATEDTGAFAAQLQAEREAWAALPRREKLERKRAELERLDVEFAKAPPEEFCPNLFDIRTSQLELEILELAGAAREWIENARDWSQRRIWAHKLGRMNETPEEAKQRYEVIREQALQARRDWQRYRWLLDESEERRDLEEGQREAAERRITARPHRREPPAASESDWVAPFRGTFKDPTEPPVV